MNPIINPLFFYFISVTDILRFLLLIGGFGVVVICVFVCFICCVDYDTKDIESPKKGVEKDSIRQNPKK